MISRTYKAWLGALSTRRVRSNESVLPVSITSDSDRSTRLLEASLFWEIFYSGRVVRSTLASQFAASSATISRATRALLARKFIVEVTCNDFTVGRRPKLLQLNPRLAYVAGIELDRDRITAAVTDMGGNLLGRSAMKVIAKNSVETTLADCKRALINALNDANLKLSQLSRIGVGHAGTLDVKNGVCLDWNGVPHWRNLPLLKLLREMFDVQISLDDRARAIALAYHLFSAGNTRHTSTIYVQIGTGIGAGIFIGGRMLRGAGQAGGEIGHMVIDVNGPPCVCGKRGCVEAFASCAATIRRVQEAMDRGAVSSLRTMRGARLCPTIEMVVSAAREGDSLARTALLETGRALGIGIANAVQLLNPSLVVLAGRFANMAQDFLLDTVKQTIAEQCFQTISRDLEVRIAPFRKDIASVGCALLAAVDVSADLLQ